MCLPSSNPRPVGMLPDGSIAAFWVGADLVQEYHVRKNGTPVSTEATGVTYKTLQEGLDDVERLNRAAVRPEWAQ